MIPLSLLDVVALLFFLACWVVYSFFNEHGFRGRRGLSSLMNEHRFAWMEEMSRRESRIVDTGIMSGLQNGTAFFASTSLLALGASVALLRATDDVLRVSADLPLGIVASRGLWELKVLGLALIFGYAFFKFAWAYRLFNYAAILVGATPAASSPHAEVRRRASRRAARMVTEAGRNFIGGQRAFFFSFAYLGWFVGPLAFIATTAATFVVIFRRQFVSASRAAVDDLAS
jgi:uncharacterized membrane protein